MVEWKGWIFIISHLKKKILGFLTRDFQEQHVDGGSLQSAHSLLDTGCFFFSRQDEGGENSHQGFDGHLVLAQRRPHALMKESDSNLTLQELLANWTKCALVLTIEALSPPVDCRWSVA